MTSRIHRRPPTKTIPPLVVQLRAKQEEMGLTNQEFAARLGVHRFHWIRTKMGERGVGRSIRLGALIAFNLVDEEQPLQGMPEAVGATH